MTTTPNIQTASSPARHGAGQGMMAWPVSTEIRRGRGLLHVIEHGDLRIKQADNLFKMWVAALNVLHTILRLPFGALP